MTSSHLCSWKSLITVLLLTPLQFYIIYRAIYKYIQLKYESQNNHLVFYSQYQWIYYLCNLQLCSVVFAIGLCPLWICCVLLATSNLKCKQNSVSINTDYYDNHFSTDGFYYKVWKKTNRITELFQEYDDVNRGKEFKTNRIECIGFYPIGALLHILIAFLLYLPTPFIDSWLMMNIDGTKESVWKSGLDSLFGRPNLQVQLDFSMEYLNLCISLILYSTQYPQLLWPSSHIYAALLFFIQLLTTTNILIDCSVVSIFIKTYFHRTLTQSTIAISNKQKTIEKTSIFLEPYFILPISFLSNAYLIILTFMNFQIGYIKCVESFSKYSVNLMNHELFGTSSNITCASNTTHNNMNNLMGNDNKAGSESTTNNNNNPGNFDMSYSINNKLLSTTDNSNQLKISQNPTPLLLSLLLIFVDISMKVIRYYYGHKEHLDMSKIFYIYTIHSSLMIVAYIFYWIWILTKQKWKFKIIDRHVRFSTNPVLKSVEYNIYKTLPVNTNHNNKISLSSISNPNNNSFRSNITDTSLVHPSSLTNLYMLHNSAIDQQQQSHSFINLSQMSPMQQYNQTGRNYRTMYACNPSMNKGSESPELSGRNTKQSSSFSYYRQMHPLASNTGSLPLTRNSSPDASVISSIKYSDYFRLNSATPTTQIINNPTPAIIEEAADSHENDDDLNKDNETSSCITDDTDDINLHIQAPSHHQSTGTLRKSGSNHNTPGSSTKFVTFQLDNDASKDSNNSSSPSQDYFPNNDQVSDDNLTLISMDPNPDNFLRELEAVDVLNNNGASTTALSSSANPVNPFQGYQSKRKPVEIMPIILSKLNEGSQV